jgi:hypothetical protein
MMNPRPPELRDRVGVLARFEVESLLVVRRTGALAKHQASVRTERAAGRCSNSTRDRVCRFSGGYEQDQREGAGHENTLS